MHPTIRAYLAAGFTTQEQMLEHARLRGTPSYFHVLGVLGESAGNIQRLLGFTSNVAKAIHDMFGPFDFTAAKLMASVVKSPDYFKDESYDESDIALIIIDALETLWGQFKFIVNWDTESLADGLINFFKANQAVVPKINSAKTGAPCIELANQAVLAKKKPIDSASVMVPLGAGWNWIDVGSCSDDVEAAEMQHCGTDNRGTLVSLRDSQNAAHVTMTYNKEDNTVYQIKGKQNTVPAGKYWPAITSFFKSTGAKLEDWWLVQAAKEEPAGDDFDHAPEFLQLLSPYLQQKHESIREGDITRQNSTAMVVVTAEPPGKNVCAMIRKLLGNHTKLIVAAQPGPLAPGNFDRLIRASMPDVEKKLRVMDVGNSVADAVSSAEQNRHYSKSQALEVFCDQQLAGDFTHEVQGGSLTFDPTVIMVKPTEIHTDDMGAISKAVFDDDLDAMHRVLDPHIFSDQDSLRTYKDVLKGGQLPSGVKVGGMSEPMPKESLQREFLTDIAGSRELGIAKLDAMLKAELGDHFDELEYLGSGRNGSAYRTPDGLIIKVTTDPKEAASAERLQGERCEYIHHIHEVSKVDEQVWIILQEGGLEKLPSQYAEEFDLAMEIVETIGAGHALRMGDANGVKEIMVKSEHKDLCMLVAEVMKKFDVGGMLREVRQFGLSADFHSGNIMMRGGRPVLTDLGTHGDDNKGPQVHGGQVSELASSPSTSPGPLQMRGSNSSAWAGGRMVLSNPEQHVPEDENETEDIVGGGLEWGRTPRLSH
jgi:hypothetical protein